MRYAPDHDLSQFVGGGEVGGGIVGAINTVVIPLLFAMAFVVSLWGVFKYFIYHGDEEEGRRDGRQFILWEYSV